MSQGDRATRTIQQHVDAGSTILLRWKFGHIPHLVSRTRQVDTIYRVGGDDINLAIKVKVSSTATAQGCSPAANSTR